MWVFDSSWEYATECGYGCSYEGYKCKAGRETFFMESLDEGDYWLMLHPYWNINGAHYVVEAHCETDDDWEDVLGISVDDNSDIAAALTIMVSIIFTVTSICISSI